MSAEFIGLGHIWTKLARMILGSLLNGKADSPERAEALDRLRGQFHSYLARILRELPRYCSALVFRPRSGRCSAPTHHSTKSFTSD